jgi:hypothetical protein
MPLTQQDLHRQLAESRTAARDEIVRLVTPLDPARLHEHPEADGWSIGEVLEHLCVSHEAYESRMKEMFRTARPDAGAPLREFKPTFLGKLLVGALESPRKVKTRPVFDPGPTPRTGVLQAFVSCEMAGIAEMEAASTLDWRREKIGSPALPGWMPKFNLGDVFRIHAVHVARHAKQVERVVKLLT